MNNINKSKSGFTIIEVVLVLAIAGLIFLIVFLAVPALQRSQRDTQRKSDLSRFMSQVSNYQSNNRGNVPAQALVADTGATGFVETYLIVNNDTFADPQGEDYDVQTGAGTVTAGQIRYAINARCGADGAIEATGTARQVASSVGLEGGGAYCEQN